MTQLEDRLREALLDTPTPPAVTGDPLADLERRVGRARTRRAIAGIAAVVALVAAIVVPLSVAGRSGSSGPAFTHPRPHVVRPVAWPDHRVLSEAVSEDGSVWTLSTSRSNNPTRYVERHEPAAGEVVATYAVPQWAEFMSAAGGQVWVWGGGDGGYPDGYVEAINQTTGHHVIRDLGKGRAILPDLYVGHPVAAVTGGLGAVLADRRSIVGLSVDHHALIETPLGGEGVAGATQAFVWNDEIIVSSPTRMLRGVSPTPEDLVEHVYPDLSGPPLAVQPRGLLVNQHSRVISEKDNEDYYSNGFKAPASNGALTVPVMAVVDRSGGLYVGWAATASHSARRLTYYSKHNLTTLRVTSHSADFSKATFNAPGPPDASIAGSFSDLGLDPAGGVVYLQGDPGSPGTVARWDPAGR